MGFKRKFSRKFKELVTELKTNGSNNSLKVASGLAAMGVAMAPALADASTVTKVGGENEFKDSSTKVANIYAMGQKGKVATNIFSDFKLDAGHIANLYFKTKDSSTESENLVNLVNSKVDISGTVNAVKNNTIGGNLFFISPKGIAVGKTGVINAGSLTMLTPTDDAFEKMLGGTGLTTKKTEESSEEGKETKAAEGGISGEFKLDDKEDNIFVVKNIETLQKMAVPINQDGSIVILGKLHAPNGIAMKAASIKIGGKEKTGEGEEAKEESVAAVLKTGEIDFTDLVNASDDAKAGLSGSLTVKKDENASGDIIISAEAHKVNSIDTYNDTFKQETEKEEDKAKSGEEEKKETKQPVKNNIKADITIAEGSTVKADGNVDIKAVATNSVPKYDKFPVEEAKEEEAEGEEKKAAKANDDDYTNKLVGGRINRTEAVVTIAGEVEGKSVSIAAEAENKYEVSLEDALKDIPTLNTVKETIGGEPLPFAFADEKKAKSGEEGEENKEEEKDKTGEGKVLYYKLYSNAKVDIGEKAKVTATEASTKDKDAINIAAKSTVELSAKPKAEEDLYPSLTDVKLTKLIPNAGLISVDTNNKATVNVKGTVKAEAEKGEKEDAVDPSISIKAEAKSNIRMGTIISDNVSEAAATGEGEEEEKPAEKPDMPNAGFVFGDIDNAAEINLGSTPKKAEEGSEEESAEANEIKAAGDIKVKADSKTVINSGLAILVSEKTKEEKKEDEPEAQAEDEEDKKKEPKLNTAITVIKEDSSSVLNVEGKVTSTAGAISLVADNTIDNHVIVNNGIKVDDFAPTEANLNVPLDKAIAYVKGNVTKGMDKLYKLDGYFTEGGAFGVVTENNKAEVNVKKSAEIKAKKNLDVKAYNAIIDNQVNVNGVIHKDKLEDKDSIVGAILHADYNNSGKVVIGEKAKLEGKAVKVEADSQFDYGRVQGMLNGVLWDIEKILKDYETKLKALDKQNLEKLKDAINKCKPEDISEGMPDISSAFSEAWDNLDFKGYTEIPHFKEDYELLKADVKAMAEVKNLANFSAGVSHAPLKPEKPEGEASAETEKKDEKDPGIKGVAASYNLINISNNAKVIVAKEAEITATGADVKDEDDNVQKALSIKAYAQQHDFAVTGHGQYIVPFFNDDKEDNTSAGGIATVHNADVTSAVVVAEGAKLNALANGEDVAAADKNKGSVDIVANNDVDIVALSFGGGHSTPGTLKENGLFDDLDNIDWENIDWKNISDNETWKKLKEADWSLDGILAEATKQDHNGLTGISSFVNGKSNSVVSVDDEAKVTAGTKGELRLKADNSTTITNIGGDITGGNVVGAGSSYAEINYKVNNISAIADNDKDAERDEKDAVKDYNKLISGTATEKEEEAEKEGEEKKKVTVYEGGILTNDEVAYLGTKENVVEGAIAAGDLSVKAVSGGVVNNLTVAGANEKDSSINKSGVEQKGKTSWKLPTIGREKNGGVDLTKGAEDSAVKYLFPINLRSSGSASVNDLEYTTAALVEKVSTTGTKHVEVKAEDTTVLGAYSGSGAVLKKLDKEPPAEEGAEEETPITGDISIGVVAFNRNDSNVVSQIKDSSFTNAVEVSNVAEKTGVDLALGMALSVTKDEESEQESASTGNGSYLESYNKVAAKMINTNVTGSAAANVNNVAYSKDIQVAGGATAAFLEKTSQATGSAVTYSVIENDINSTVEGGSFKKIGDMNVLAATHLVQVGTAVGIANSKGEENLLSGYGAIAVNSVTNNVTAELKGAKAEGEETPKIEIEASNLKVASFDGKLSTDTTTAAEERKRLLEVGDLDGDGKLDLDLDAKDALADANAGQGDVEVSAKKDGEETTDIEYTSTSYGEDSRKGNVQVASAVTVVLDKGSAIGTGAIASADNKFNNDYLAKIGEGAKITLPKSGSTENGKLDVKAELDTLQVAVGAGVAVNTSETGSYVDFDGTINDVEQKNKAIALVEKAKLTAKTINVKADNDSLLVNVVGQASAAKSTAVVGIANADNIVDSTTGAYVYGSELNTNDLTVEALNTTKEVAVAAAVNVALSGGFTVANVNGNVVVNQVTNNTEAIVDGAKDEESGAITSPSSVTAKNITVHAKDESKLTGVAGNVSVGMSGASAAGAAVANVIGSDGNQQQTRAQINNTTITSVDEGALTVKAEDKSKAVGVAAGVVVSVSEAEFSTAAEGSVATTVLNKNNEASMTNVTMENEKMAVAVTAKSDSASYTSADAISVDVPQGASAGAYGVGVAVNKSNADTKAFIDNTANDKAIKAKSVEVAAESKNKLFNVGMGVSVSVGGYGAGAANIAVNNINNDTLAYVKNADLKAANGVMVTAKSSEDIDDYIGAVSVNVGQGYAAGGVSVAVNNIYGDTKAEILESAIEAGTGDVKVTAEADHDISNVVVTAGVAVTDGVAVGFAGTNSFNTIEGDTVAKVENSTKKALKGSNVTVKAQDKADILSVNAFLSGGVSGAVAVAGGEASDSVWLNRDVVAEISKTNMETGNLDVEAINTNKVKTNSAGASFAFSGTAGVGVGATVVSTDIDGTTVAKVADTDATLSGDLTINADHESDLLATNNFVALAGGTGAGTLGAAVTVINDSSATVAELDNSNIQHTNTDASDAITAYNKTKQLGEIAQLGLAIGIGGAVGANINVDSIDNEVHAKVSNSTIGSESKRANEVTVEATNDMTVDFYSVEVEGGSIVGGAVGVGVIGVDTTVTTDILGSDIYAEKATIAANENRNFEQLSVAAAVGGYSIGSSVMVTNIGNSVDTNYEYTQEFENKDGKKSGTTEVDMTETFGIVDQGIKSQKDRLSQSLMGGVLGEVSADKKLVKNGKVSVDSGLTMSDIGNNAKFDRKDGQTHTAQLQKVEKKTNDFDAKKSQAEFDASKVTEVSSVSTALKGTGVQVNAAGSTIDAGKGDLIINSNAVTNVDQEVYGANVGMANLSVAVGVVDVTRQGGVTITADEYGNRSVLKGNNININTLQDGLADQTVGQGALGGVNINAAIGVVDTNGTNEINITGAELEAQKDINVEAVDNYGAKVDTVGVAIGGFNGGAIVADAQNNSNTVVVIQDANLSSQQINVDAAKQNNVTAMAASGALGAVNVSGTVAIANDKGSSKVLIGDKENGSVNTFVADAVNVNVANKPKVEAKVYGVNAALAAISGSVAKASATGNVTASIQGKNIFETDTVNVNALAEETAPGKENVKASVMGVGVGGLMLGANVALAETKMNVNIDVDSSQNTYKSGTIKVLDKPAYKRIEVYTELVGGAYEAILDDDGNYIERSTENDAIYTAEDGYRHAQVMVLDELHSTYIDVEAPITSMVLNAENTTTSYADAGSYNVALGVVSSSLAFNNAIGTTSVTVKGGSTEDKATELKSLEVVAHTSADQKLEGDNVAVTIADISPVAIRLENDAATEAYVGISGNFVLQEDLKVDAQNTARVNMDADSTSIALAGISGAHAYNDMRGTTKVDLTKGSIKTGGDIDVKAQNNVIVGDEKEYSVDGISAALFGAGGVVLSNTATERAIINVAGSNLTSDGSQTIAAYSDSNINSKAKILSVEGIGASVAYITDELKFDNQVNIENASLKTNKIDQDINLSANDNLAYNIDSVATLVSGIGVSVTADSNADIQRNNSINLNKGADVYSKRDVNLYAGKDAAGKDSRLDMVAEAEAYNHSAIPIHNAPKLNYNINQQNQVNVADTAKSQSVYDTNVSADSGVEKLRKTVITYKWYDSDGSSDYASTNMGQSIAGSNHDNSINIEGTVQAGVRNKQHIYIGTDTENEIVITNKNFRDNIDLTGLEDYKIVDYPTIDASEEIRQEGIEISEFNYSQVMIERYQEILQLIADYSDNTKSTAYVGYCAEAQRLEAQMREAGIMVDVDGKTVILNNMMVDQIKLPDLIASGGDVYLKTSEVKGQGTIEAKGSPEIDIVNNTNLYMVVNNAEVGHPGGNVVYNEVSVNKIAGFDGEVIAAPGQPGLINIESNYSGPETVKTKFTENSSEGEFAHFNGTNVELNRNLKADIEINGYINAPSGTVKINNENNDIIIQGNTVYSGSGISAAEIHLSAPNGTISQGYSEGITNIGGSVKTQYASEYNKIKDDLITNYVDAGADDESLVVADDVHKTVQGGRIAGENIYINAESININGTIQVGYKEYKAVIDPNDTYEGKTTVQDRIDLIKASWVAKGSKSILDSTVEGNTSFRITAGGSKQNADGTYSKNLIAYYNPSTDTILVPQVDAKGGKIYLTGRISSTGSGQIIAMDGNYDVAILNHAPYDLKIKNMVTNDVKGLINITDTNYTYTNSKGESGNFYTVEMVRDEDKNTVVTYKGLDGKELSSTEIASIASYNPNTGSYTTVGAPYDAANEQYQPVEGQRYNWTDGFSRADTYTYQNKKTYGLWWDWYKDSDKTELTDKENFDNQIEFIAGKAQDKLTGEYIDYNDLKNYTLEGATEKMTPAELAQLQDKEFYVVFDRTITEDNRTDPKLVADWEHGFLNWFHTYVYEWQRKTGSINQFVGSVKADQPIKVGFIGNKDGRSEVNIVTAKNLLVDGNIGNEKVYKEGTESNPTYQLKSDITLEAVHGSINQLSGKLYGDDITLKAGESINGIKVMTGDNTKLTAISTADDSTEAKDVTVSVTTTHVPNAQGTVHVGNVGGAAVDEVILKVDGDLVQDNNTTKIEGGMIDIVAQGAVGTDAQDVLVKVAQAPSNGNDPLSASLNVKADKDIFVQQTEGDLRLGTVASANGDVTITTPGSLIDAIPYDEENDRGGEAYLIKKWTDLGLIGSAESEWTKDQLLYAISESIINPESGHGYKSMDKAPNVSGHNITLNIGKDTGKNSDNVDVIDINDVGELENLKKLAAVDASSVDWNATLKEGVDNSFKPDGQVIINDKLAIGVQNKDKLDEEGNVAEIGVVTVNRLTEGSSGNIYLQNRNNGTDYEGQNLNLNNIDAGEKGNILLESIGSITNAGKDPVIKGNDLYMLADNGAIGSEDKPVTVALNGDLSAVAGNGIINIDSPLADKNLIIKNVSGGNNGDIVITAVGDIDSKADSQGYIRTEGEGNIILKSSEGSIGATTAVRIKNVEEDEEEWKNASKDTQTVTAEAEKGSVKLEGITAGVTPETSEGTMYLKAAKAKDEVSVVANGNLKLLEEASASAGDVELKAAEKLQDSGLVAGTNVELTSENANIDQTETGKVVADKLTASAQLGIELNNGQPAESDDSRLYNELNSAELNNGQSGNVVLGNGGDNGLEVTVSDGKGGELHADEVLLKNYTNGNTTDMNVNGAMVTTGTAEVINEEGSLKINDDITSDTNINIEAAGDITVDGKLTTTIKAEKGDINVSADQGDVNITKGSDIQAQGNGDISITSNKGDMNINANVVVGTYLTDGSGEKVINEDGMPVAQDNTGAGDIIIKTAEGNINTPHDMSLLPDHTDNYVGLVSLNGSVGVETGLGDVNLYEILAQEKASAGTLDGNLTLHSVNGNIVALYTKDMSNKLMAEKAVVGDTLILAGNDIEMDDISQRPSGPDMLKVDLRSAKDDEPTNKVKLNFTKVNKGVEFLRLWVTNADVGLKDGMLYFDKLAVAGKATLTNKDMQTTVYGKDPIKDGSDSIYWYDYEHKNPKDNLGSYFEETALNYANNNPYSWYYPKNTGNKWTYVFFEEPKHIQKSNGNLLHLTDDYYVYNQRYSEENLLRFMHDVNNPLNIWADNFSPDPDYFFRYNLYELPEGPVVADKEENKDK